MDPADIEARHKAALVLGFEGDHCACLAALAALAAQVPSNLNVKYDLAMTQMMLGLYEEACAPLRQILAVNPNHENALKQATYC